MQKCKHLTYQFWTFTDGCELELKYQSHDLNSIRRIVLIVFIGQHAYRILIIWTKNIKKCSMLPAEEKNKCSLFVWLSSFFAKKETVLNAGNA